MSDEMARTHRLAAVVGLCLAVAGSPALGAEHKFDGDYSGKKVLTKGLAKICPTEEDVSVTIHGEALTFTDSELKKFTEPFYLGPDGSFGETYTDEGGHTAHYHGHIVGDVIDADTENPSCEYHWHLRKN